MEKDKRCGTCAWYSKKEVLGICGYLINDLPSSLIMIRHRMKNTEGEDCECWDQNPMIKRHG